MAIGRPKTSANSDLTPGVLKPLDPDFCPFCGGKVDYHSTGCGEGLTAGCNNQKCPVKPRTFGSNSAAVVRNWWSQIYTQADRLIEVLECCQEKSFKKRY
jgi:hypothetical protein